MTVNKNEQNERHGIIKKSMLIIQHSKSVNGCETHKNDSTVPLFIEVPLLSVESEQSYI